MLVKRTFLFFVTIGLASCNDTKVEVTDKPCSGWYYSPNKKYVEVILTNTSTSKILEVTVKREHSDGQASTRFETLKPGEIRKLCESTDTEISIVAEREIK
jgi:hypothetical protein